MAKKDMLYWALIWCSVAALMLSLIMKMPGVALIGTLLALSAISVDKYGRNNEEGGST